MNAVESVGAVIVQNPQRNTRSNTAGSTESRSAAVNGVSTAIIGAQQPAKNDLPGSRLDEAEIRKLVDPHGVDQFRRREDATKRLSELADVPPALLTVCDQPPRRRAS
jgi:hypothetical protein